MTKTYTRPAFACVDWDDTCVEPAWPGTGDWKPGAVRALKMMSEAAPTYIYTARIAPVYPDGTPRPPGEAEAEVQGIRRKLDEAGLRQVRIWTKPYKPNPSVFVDDKAVRYPGGKKSWDRILPVVMALLGKDEEIEVPA